MAAWASTGTSDAAPATVVDGLGAGLRLGKVRGFSADEPPQPVFDTLKSKFGPAALSVLMETLP